MTDLKWLDIKYDASPRLSNINRKASRHPIHLYIYEDKEKPLTPKVFPQAQKPNMNMTRKVIPKTEYDI